MINTDNVQNFYKIKDPVVVCYHYLLENINSTRSNYRIHINVKNSQCIMIIYETGDQKSEIREASKWQELLLLN